MRGDVVFERKRRPLNHGRLALGAGLATVAAVAGMVVIDPAMASVAAVLGGVLTMVFGLLVTERAAYGGLLHRLRSTLHLDHPPAAESYREVPRGPDIVYEGKRVPRHAVRELVVGHIDRDTGSGQSLHSWPLFLVCEDRVLELDIFDDREEALAAQAALAERLELPAREVDTGLFGEGAQVGCLLGAVTMTTQLAAVLGGGLGGVFLENDTLKTLLPALMILTLWAVSGIATRVAGKSVRPAVDVEVRETFELRRPRVRVAPERDDVELTLELEEAQLAHARERSA